MNPAKRAEDYDSFWSDYEIMPWCELSEKYFREVPQPQRLDSKESSYYSIPLVKRYYKHHYRNLIHYYKVKIINYLKGKDQQ